MLNFWPFNSVSSPAPLPQPVFSLAAAVKAFTDSGYRLGLTKGAALALRNQSQWLTPQRLQLETWLWNHMVAQGASNEFSDELCARFELALRCSATETPEVIK